MCNCRDCPNLIIVTEHGELSRKCAEMLDTRYEDHNCYKYERVEAEEKVVEEKVIAVDFDGPCHEYSKGWQDGIIYDVPTEGVFRAFEKLNSKGYKIVIFTARNNLEPVKKWVNGHLNILGLSHLEIEVTNKKPKAIMYIDDRAIRFTSWKDVLKYF